MMNSILLLVLILGLTCLVATEAAAFSGSSPFEKVAGLPDSVVVVTESEKYILVRQGEAWKAKGITVTTHSQSKGMLVTINAPLEAIRYVNLAWKSTPPEGWKYLGDAWERGYGDLEWKLIDPKRTMPWYFLASDGTDAVGCGVTTGPAAFCEWSVHKNEVVLHADIRCGGQGVMLGSRALNICTIAYQPVITGISPFKAMRAFCSLMCPKPLKLKQPVYGFNDWYCDYGSNTADSVADYARFVVKLSPKGANRPFMVIDDGWQPPGPASGGPWNIGNEKFPSMPDLAKEIETLGATPGIWVRLLTAQKFQPGSWRLRDERSTTLDPSKPEVRAYVVKTTQQLRTWGYKLIKHDFSTFDIFGEWNNIIPKDTDNWAFADRSRTSAEIITDFYKAIREGAGDALIIGCNTLSHLSAGIFEMNRTGDDTSGREWARVLKMGVNTMAFRAAHEGTFYGADADCIGLTEKDAIPWSLNRQWLQLLSQSGTPLFISFKRGSLTEEMEKEIAAALEIASKPQPLAEPLDWFTELQPRKWKLMGNVVEFKWSE